MGTCVVFGAGASLDNAQHFELGVRTPPLDTTFFEKIRELEVRVPPALRVYAEGLPTGSPFTQAPGSARMEEFFEDLFFDFSSEGEANPHITEAYTELIGVYRSVIGKTTDWMIADKGKKGGPVGRVVSWAVDHADSVTLLTFNQDLILENEIHKRRRLREMWCIEHCYGAFSNRAVMLPRKSELNSFDHHGKDCDGGSRLTILKLHGSLNWQIKMNGRNPSPRILAGTGSYHPKIRVTRRRRVPTKLRVSRSTGTRGRSVWYMWPVLVPPVYNKQVLIKQFLQDVWADAQEALVWCDRLVLYGYSLPPTDIEAEKLFQRSVFRNDDLVALDVINPDPATATRYARLAPKKTLRWFPDVESFLRDG